MSVIRVDNFGPSAGGTTYSARGIAKAWVGFKGTATVAIENGSENVTSITDNGTGDFTINFTNNMNSGTDYIITGTAGLNTTSLKCFCQPYNLAAPAAGSVRIQTPESDGGLSTDPRIVFATIHGDLA